MRKTILFWGSIISLSLFSSCVKCYVCKDKTSNEFSKEEFCSKDFDKGDVDAIIEARENAGQTCHAKTRAF